ncbi:MAG: DUF4340 domain-containing protein [Pedosphaera sp.]|nr:DUF4340 domain-containing protein [Pedosphaera sp.]
MITRHLTRETILLTALAAGLALYTFLFEWSHAPVDGNTRSKPRLGEFNSRDVQSVEFFQHTNRFKAVRDGAGWTLTQPINYPAHNIAIEALIHACARLESLNAIDPADVKGGLADFGLAPAKSVIRLQGTHQPFELQLGNSTLLGKRMYASLSSTKSVHIIADDLQMFLPRSVDDWRSHLLFPNDAQIAGVDRIALRNGNRTMELLKNPTNATWQVIAPLPVKRADKNKIFQFLQQMQHWQVTDFVAEPPAGLFALGLQNPPVELTVAHGTNWMATVAFGNSPTNQPDAIFARRAVSGDLFKVSRDWLDKLQQPVWEFCDRRLVDPIIPSQLHSIEVRSGNPFTVARNPEGSWQFTRPDLIAADTELVEDLLKQLRQIEAVELAKEVVTDFKDFGLDPPGSSYLLWEKSAAADGTNRLRARVDFGHMLGDRIYARRHDESSVYLLNLGDARRLPDAHYQLRARRIWEFTSTQVTSVVVTQKNKQRRYQRNERGTWTSEKGVFNDVENTAFEETLLRLGQVRAESWTAAGADKLALYGFIETPHSITLEMNLGGKTVSRTLQFGRRSAYQRPYATIHELNATPVIFEFPKAFYDEFVLRYLVAP